MGALVAARLAEAGVRDILVVEAGPHALKPRLRARSARRWMRYLERPWSGDRVEARARDASAQHRHGPTMYVGGQATHWNAQTPRFTPEDFRLRSLYGYGRDWPISYEDLEPYYAEAERRIGVSGEPDEGPRSTPFPMPPIPESYDLRHVREWAGRAGLRLHAAPYAKNSRPYDGRPACVRCDTCYVCPTGAKYSPDFTLRALEEAGTAELLSHVAVRRLDVDGNGRVTGAQAVETETGDALALESETFVLAGGFPFAPHLLLRSTSNAYPRGLANASGTLGRFIQGHPVVITGMAIPDRLFGFVHEQNRLMTRRFMREPRGPEKIRFDLSAMVAPHLPYLRNAAGDVQLADQVVEDWRARSKSGLIELRSMIDVYFGEQSRIEDDPRWAYPWGDPLPKANYVYDAAPEARKQAGGREVRRVVKDLANRAGGRVQYALGPKAHPHRGGGCRMGDDPATSVCDSYGRTHDHPNLYVTGAPLLVTGGCTNTTLTFCALALRTAEKLAAETTGKNAERAKTEPA